MEKEKIREMWAEYINGNISVFKEDINKLTKKELLDLVCYAVENSEKTIEEIIALIYTCLDMR